MICQKMLNLTTKYGSAFDNKFMDNYHIHFQGRDCIGIRIFVVDSRFFLQTTNNEIMFFCFIVVVS